MGLPPWYRVATNGLLLRYSQVVAGAIRTGKWQLPRVFVDFNRQYVRSGHYGEVWDFFCRAGAGKLKEGGPAGGPPSLDAAFGNGPGTFPPTPAMKRFADSLARHKGIKPPPGYKTSISICRKFLNEHAPKKAESETLGKLDTSLTVISAPSSPAIRLRSSSIDAKPNALASAVKGVALQ